MFVEPLMTVRVNVLTWLVPLTTSCKPVGLVWNVNVTVSGERRTLAAPCRPRESAAVSLSSRCAGYSWSGAVKEPLATPVKVWSACVWQFEGQ